MTTTLIACAVTAAITCAITAAVAWRAERWWHRHQLEHLTNAAVTYACRQLLPEIHPEHVEAIQIGWANRLSIERANHNINHERWCNQ